MSEDIWSKIKQLYHDNGFTEAAADMRDIRREWFGNEDRLLKILEGKFAKKTNGHSS